MHEIDTFIPYFFSRVWGTRIVVTPDIVSEVLHVPRVAHPDYPSCACLWIVSKDELSSLFCETPSSWGDHQNTPCLGFAKGSRFLNMVMTFILHPLSHYNSIIEPRAPFFCLLSRVSSLHSDVCHRCSYHSTKWGTAQTEAALNRDGNSSSFYRSIHLLSFVFCGWSDSWDHHGTACTYGCSPWHT